ncbi:GntR family transcriptional regulator [Tersicoccus solisilvae]|uniref:GntR family transcriptional regulator n=1 Tax=Tersicoccus solisilvae TaxID=1882339 RepID=A0ABQ1PG16_9MICC|nr:GntR family transcriptional regulator [Tersicoccus solisilvae]GGC96557.1 GntR family transcriptional regulator [Tersicoccus solisilvae]
MSTLADSWTVGPIGRVSAPLRAQVITALRRAILDFDLKPGQRLVERELIERLGVSRTTIREALRELTSEGLVTVVPHRGAMVSAPSLTDAADLYEVRASLESLVTQRFVERATDDDVDRLRAAVDDLAAVSDEDHDIRTILQAKDRFYGVLVAGARSEALRQLLEGIQARVQVLRATSLSEAGRAPEAVRELRAVLDAITRRDADLAARRCADHVRNAAVTALHSLRAAEDE